MNNYQLQNLVNMKMKKLTDSVWFLAVFNAHSYISNSKVWAPALQNKAALLCTHLNLQTLHI